MKLVNIPTIFKSNRYIHPKLYKDVIMTAPRYSQHPGHRKYIILLDYRQIPNLRGDSGEDGRELVILLVSIRLIEIHFNTKN